MRKKHLPQAVLPRKQLKTNRMKLDAKKIVELVDLLEMKTNTQKNGRGFDKMALALNEFDKFPDMDRKYLQSRLYKPACDLVLSGGGKIGLNIRYIDKIARFIGYKSFMSFMNGEDLNAKSQMIKLCGQWYCYTRTNTHQSELIQSPVRIFEKKDEIFYELKGYENVYCGKLSYESMCLFAQFKSKTTGQQFQHVYKIGLRKTPQVVQGIFSGVSSSFDPIGGRAVLIRQFIPYKQLFNLRIAVEKLPYSKKLEQRRLGEYFAGDSNIIASNAVTFDLNDLGECG